MIELYRTSELWRPFRTPENIRSLANWPQDLCFDKETVQCSWISGAHKEGPEVDAVKRALKSLFEQGFIMANQDFTVVAIIAKGLTAISAAIPARDLPQKAFQLVYGGTSDRD